MFLCCGDTLFDLFAEPSEDVASIELSGRVGGSALNVALGLARLGHPTGYFTKIASDLFGQRIRSFMDRENIDQSFLVPTERNTTLAVVSVSSDGTPAYRFYIEGTADRSVEPEDVPARFPAALAAIHVSSYSTVVQPTASALAHLIRQEYRQRFVSYDLNVRSSVEPDLDLWRAKASELAPMAGLVKASDEDLRQLFPGRSDDSILADWLAAGAAMAVITHGEKGAVAATAGGLELAVPSQRTTVVDTVGAGDTFQAALLAGLFETGLLSREAIAKAGREAVERTLHLAVRAAAVTCARRGANLPTRLDLGLAPLTGD